MDWSMLYDPVYATLGVEAVLTLPGTDGAEIELTALDKTSGVVVGSDVEVQTVEPAAVVRHTELSASEGFSLSQLRDSSLLMNGKTWKVRNYSLRPAPTGEEQGEVMLLLTELD